MLSGVPCLSRQMWCTRSYVHTCPVRTGLQKPAHNTKHNRIETAPSLHRGGSGSDNYPQSFQSYPDDDDCETLIHILCLTMTNYTTDTEQSSNIINRAFNEADVRCPWADRRLVESVHAKPPLPSHTHTTLLEFCSFSLPVLACDIRKQIV